MAQNIRLHLGWVSILVLCLCDSQAKTHEDVHTQSSFYQTREPTGEYMVQLNKDEIFNVDLDKKKTRWRLPQFGEVATFEAAGALQVIAVMKINLEVAKQMSNSSKATNGRLLLCPPPFWREKEELILNYKKRSHGRGSKMAVDVHCSGHGRTVAPNILVYSKDPVILGEPNTLICAARQFFPPVTQMIWMKNSEPVSVGVSETDFYPAPDGSFSKFLYLATVPQKGEVYTCSVVHPGQAKNPTNKFWRPEIPQTFDETKENIICGLGLFIGICGIITGIALICKGRKDTNQGRRQ